MAAIGLISVLALPASLRADSEIQAADFLPAVTLYLHHVPSMPKLRAWLMEGDENVTPVSLDANWRSALTPGAFGSPIPAVLLANQIFAELSGPLGEELFLAILPGKGEQLEFITGGRTPAANTLIFKLQDKIKAEFPEIQWKSATENGVEVRSGDLGNGLTLRLASTGGWLFAGTAPQTFSNALARSKGGRVARLTPISQTPIWKSAISAQPESNETWLSLDYVNFDAIRRLVPATGDYAPWVEFFKTEMAASPAAVVTEYAAGPMQEVTRAVFIGLSPDAGRQLKAGVQALGESNSRWVGHDSLLAFSSSVDPKNLFKLAITSPTQAGDHAKFWLSMLEGAQMSGVVESHALVEQGALPEQRYQGWLIHPSKGGVVGLKQWFETQSLLTVENQKNSNPVIAVAPADSAAEFELKWSSGHTALVAFTDAVMVVATDTESVAFFYDKILGSAKPGLPSLVKDSWALRTAPNAFLDLLVDRHGLLEHREAIPADGEIDDASTRNDSKHSPARLTIGLTAGNHLLAVQTTTLPSQRQDLVPFSWLSGLDPAGLARHQGALVWWANLVSKPEKPDESGQADEAASPPNWFHVAGQSGLLTPQRPGKVIVGPDSIQNMTGPMIDWLSWVLLALGNAHPSVTGNAAPDAGNLETTEESATPDLDLENTPQENTEPQPVSETANDAAPTPESSDTTDPVDASTDSELSEN